MSQIRPKIGVLALQGDFEAHCRALERAGAEPLEIRTAGEFESLDGLVLPGGESSAMLKLIDQENLFDRLKQFGQQRPIFGTCAGAILLASEVLNPEQPSLKLMDYTVQRNGYGRQIDSRIASIDIEGQKSEAVFIRAPVIQKTGPEVHVLSTYLDQPVLVEQGRHLAATFHPELSPDSRVHERFVAKVKEAAS